MKDKLASLPQTRVSPHIWEEFWNKWPRQWATLLRIFLARTAAEVTQFGMKTHCTVYATDGGERDQEWLCMQCGKWFPSRAACIGHQGVNGRDPTRRLAAGSQCPVCQTEFHLRERLRRHLRYGTRRCVQAAREVPALPEEEEVERLDAVEAIERKRRARAGIGRMWGPPCQRAQRCMDPECSDDGHVICPVFSSGASSDSGDFDWTASAASRGRWWNGAPFRKGRVWLFSRALVARFPEVHGLAVHPTLFRLTGCPFVHSFFHQFSWLVRVGWLFSL